MRYSGIIFNDVTAAPGLCVTLFTQGCPHRCPGCHNPDTWDFEGGQEFTISTLHSIITGLTAQGIQRNLCIMGGEPLCFENSYLTSAVVTAVKQQVPEAKIYVWTGYTYERLLEIDCPHINTVLALSDYLIDGPYIEAERDITLSMRGSRNQRIIDLSEKK